MNHKKAILRTIIVAAIIGSVVAAIELNPIVGVLVSVALLVLTYYMNLKSECSVS